MSDKPEPHIGLDNDALRRMPFLISNVIAGDQLTKTRMAIVFSIVSVSIACVCVAVVVAFLGALADARVAREKQNIHLYAKEGGLYAKGETMPKGHITDFVKNFEMYYYNWNPESVEANKAKAASNMVSRFAIKNEDERRKNVLQSSGQVITQFVAATREKPSDKKIKYNIRTIKNGLGYEVKYRARRNRVVIDDVYQRDIGTITIALQRFIPSADNHWGLRVIYTGEEWTTISK